MPDNQYLIPKIDNPFDVSIALPGSKSIALRQMAMCTMTEGKSVLRGVPICDDILAMEDCLKKLGLLVTAKEDVMEITGPMNLSAPVSLDARMSGASTRLLIALAALRDGTTHIDGHESLRARTNKPLLEVLESAGCKVDSAEGHLPLSINGPIKTVSSLRIDGSLSSQYATALLLMAAGHNEQVNSQVVISGELVSKPYIDITLNEMKKRGVHASWRGDQEIQIDKTTRYQNEEVLIEGDATAATYAATLACIHEGTVTFKNLGDQSLQGDYQYFQILREMGATVSTTSGTTTVQGPKQFKKLATADMKNMPDAALTLIALAPLLQEELTISGLSSLHHKECDRLECSATELLKMGITVEKTHETITIQPTARRNIQKATLSTYHDHRMAMAFSLIGSVCGQLTVDDKNVVDKTYPNFWKDYENLC